MSDAFCNQRSTIIDKDFIQSHFCVKFTEPSCSFADLLGGGVDKSLNLVGCGRAGLLFLLFGLWRSDLVLQLQLCPVSPCPRPAAEHQFSTFPSHSMKTFSCSNNCEQDAVLISIINGCTSVYSATVIYSIIGFRAMQNFDDCMAEWVPKCKDGVRYDDDDDGRHFAHPALLLVNSNILKVTNFFSFPEDTITQSNYEDFLSYINKTNPGTLETLDLTHCNLEKFLSQVS